MNQCILPDELYLDDMLSEGYRTDVPIKPVKIKPQRTVSDIELVSASKAVRKQKKRVVRLSDVKNLQIVDKGNFNNLNKLKDPREKNLTLDFIEANFNNHNNSSGSLWKSETKLKSLEYLVDSGRESGSPPRLHHGTRSDSEDISEIKNFGFILGPGYPPKKKSAPKQRKRTKSGSALQLNNDSRAASSLGSVSKWAEILQNNRIMFCGSSAPIVTMTTPPPQVLPTDQRNETSQHGNTVSSPAPSKSKLIRSTTDINSREPRKPPAKPPRLRHTQSAVNLANSTKATSPLPPADKKSLNVESLPLCPLKIASSMEGVEIKTLAYFGRPVPPPPECDHDYKKRRTKDASSSNEAVHLQQRLKSLSTELVTLRKRLSVAHNPEDASPIPPPLPLTNNTIVPTNDKNNNTIGEIITSTYENIGEFGDIKPPLAPSLICKRNGNSKDFCSSPPKTLVEVNDLIHISGPLTEDSILRTLHARFFQKQYFTNIGPVLLSANCFNDRNNNLTLTSINGSINSPELLKVVHEAARQQGETGYPQAIILSGESGSGKTYASMVLLRQLFDVAGGGPETDSFKHLAAAFTVLRSLGTAKTVCNSQSSRIGHFIEVQATDGVLYRTKIHCYLLDQSRIISQSKNEKNYHIFYQMLAGLTIDEKMKLHLENYTVDSLEYLKHGDTQCDTQLDASRFINWKSALALLGIPHMDVVRVLAAVLLLGNIKFVDKSNDEVDVESGVEMKSVASLLGISSVALFSSLTRRTKNVRGQSILTTCTASCATKNRDALAKSLYCRTVATIVRRANSLKGMGSISGTLSSDSNESVHNQVEVSSQHASTVGSSGAKSHKSMNALNSAVKHATDGFIGILDMFGFENIQQNRLEQLCINLCAETMQHFYNTHVFKSSLEACKDEGVTCDLEIEYADNVPCIDLISSLRTGLLSMADIECSIQGTPESYVEKVAIQHRNNPTFYRPVPSDPTSFAIRHYAGNAVYNVSNILECNRDAIADDVICLFHKNSCNFGFVTHLFSTEMKALYAQNHVPKGAKFRISPTTNFDLTSNDEPISTLTQDFHTRLDNLLRTLVHAKPHFIRCIRTNTQEQPCHFDRHCVMKQLRALQILETVNLMASGYAHRMRFRAFNNRYRLLAPFKALKRTEEKAVLDSQLILEYFTEALKSIKLSNASVNWSLGKRHIFLSENARQQLERFREQRRQTASVLIQGAWKKYQHRKKLGLLRRPQPKARSEMSKSIGASANMSVVSVPVGQSWNGSLKRSHQRSGATSTASRYLNTSQATISRSLNQSAHNLNVSMNSCLTQPMTQQQTITSSRTATLSKTGTLTRTTNGGRPRPQPISGTPPPEVERCDARLIQQTCALFGLDLERPPPVPPSRTYTVTGNAKLGYPQARVMKMNYPGKPTPSVRSKSPTARSNAQTKSLQINPQIDYGSETSRGGRSDGSGFLTQARPSGRRVEGTNTSRSLSVPRASAKNATLPNPGQNATGGSTGLSLATRSPQSSPPVSSGESSEKHHSRFKLNSLFKSSKKAASTHSINT